MKGRLPKLCVAQLGLWQLRCDGDFFACFETACSQSSVRNLRVSLLFGSRQNQIHVRDGGLRRKAPEYSRHFQRVEEHLKDQVSFRRRRAHNDLAYRASLSN